MDLKQYNTLQRRIFTKYRLQNMYVTNRIEFGILCSKISEQRECVMCYSTVKSIILEVRKYLELIRYYEQLDLNVNKLSNNKYEGDENMCYIREITNFKSLKDLKLEKEGVSEYVLIYYVERFVYKNRVYSRYYIATDDFEATLSYKDVEFKKGEIFLIDDDDNVRKESE